MVGKPQDLNQGWPSSQSLIELIDELKEAGYNIGVGQYVAAQDLLLALIAQSGRLDQPESLKSLLGPLLCSSPTEQDDFQYRFDQWAVRIGLTAGPVRPPNPQAEKLDQKLQSVQQQQRQWVRVVLGVLIALVLSFGIFQLWPALFPPPGPTLPSPTGSPIKSLSPSPSPNSPQPSTGPSPSSSSSPDPELKACLERPLWWGFLRDEQIQLSLLLLLPLPLLLAWSCFWFWQAHQFLVRRGTTQPPELERISIAGVDENLFPPLTFLRIAQGLRRRIRVASPDIDIAKTVQETARRVGWFTPVYDHRQVLPEYLVLIDRTSPDDHQSRFIEAMLDRLVQNGVFISRYFFKDDPRTCFPVFGQGMPCQLQELVTKHGQDRLVMFSETEGLLSAQTGELEPWMAVFSAWPVRAVLTPEPAQHWGYPERELARQFTVLPLTIAGLLQFISSLDLGRSTFAPTGSAKDPLPSTLREWPRRWLQREAPDSKDVDLLLASLRRYLGSDGYYWFSACAVFPRIHWDLTVYLGQSLPAEDGQTLLELQRLIDMARLPWFRYAYMPDWLRIRLIAALPRQQEQNIRKTLAALLVTAVQGPVSRFQLEIAREHKNVVSGLVVPLLDRLSRKVSRDSFLQDYLFRDFMAGLKPSKLAVRMPSGQAVPMRLTRRRLLQLAGWASVGMGGGLLWHRGLRSQECTVVTVDATGKIARCQQLRNEFQREDLGSEVSLDLMRIPAGKFLMGAPDNEEGRSDYEGPQVNVSAFLLGRYPVTQAQWRAVAALPKIKTELKPEPSNFQGDRRPVEQVSWEEAIKFCARLSKKTGREYRLPSEAEWEYACRARTTTPFHFGETITTDLANYNGNDTYGSGPKGKYREATTEVGSFQVANAFGLFDMHGNVWEWCQDHWHENYQGAPADGSPWVTGGDASLRVLRGGSWLNYPWNCRSAVRFRYRPDFRNSDFGFRVVCSSAWTL